MDTDAIMEDLFSPEGTCYMTAYGMGVSNEYIAQGIKFAVPTIRNGELTRHSLSGIAGRHPMITTVHP